MFTTRPLDQDGGDREGVGVMETIGDTPVDGLYKDDRLVAVVLDQSASRLASLLNGDPPEDSPSDPSAYPDYYVDQLPDPDQVGQSEYRAVYELLDSACDGWELDAGMGPKEWLLGIIDELEGWTTNVRRQLESM